MNSKFDHLIYLIKEDLSLFISISFGVFLFVLFFQPFPLDRFEFDNRLIFVSGLGAIVFLFIVLVRAAFIWIMHYYYQSADEPVFPSYLSGFIILVLSSVSFAFYLRYVGLVSISFNTMFKVVLICLFPPVALGIYDEIKELRQHIDILIEEKKTIQKQIKKHKEDYLNKSIEFVSENSTEIITLPVTDIALIKSADNYVEIVYKEGEHIRKKLIRNTLKNIEHQIKSYSNFIRCHRICIVNMLYIEKLNSKYNNHWLTIKDYQEQIPVSRQYLLRLKEAI